MPIPNADRAIIAVEKLTVRCSSSASAFLVISTRYAMLTPQSIEHLPRWLRAADFHIRQPALNPFDGLDAVEQRLVSRRVLHHQLRFSIYGQDERMSGLAKAIEQLDGVALEITERANVVGQIEHEYPHQIYIEFDAFMMR
jgi:hypothetical protein